MRRKNKLSPELVETNYGWQQHTDLEICLTIFLRDCRIRNLSDHTLTFYRNELRNFMKQIGEQNPNLITADDIKERVILAMMEEGRKESAINARLRAIRTFFNFLHKNGYIVRNPMEEVKLIREKRIAIPTFTRQQIRDLLAQPDRTTFTGQRDLTMMMLLFETGVRVRELVGIHVDDINFDENLIRIRDPKNYKERFVPFQATMKRQLNHYLQLRGELDHNILFINLDNKPISIRWFQEQMQRYGKMAGIKGVRVSPHTARHTFAKLCVQSGMSVFALQKVLGHSSLEMVRRYVELFSQDVAREHRKHSPIEQVF